MRRTAVLLVAAATALAASPSLAEQPLDPIARTGAAQPDEARAAMTVVRIDPQTKQIKAESMDGVAHTVLVDAGTLIEKHEPEGMLGDRLQFADVRPGDRIVVTGASDGDSVTARRLQIIASDGRYDTPASPPTQPRPGVGSPPP